MNKPIAIIGVSFKLPGIDTWEDLENSISSKNVCIGDAPENRKADIFPFTGEFDILDSGFLSEIDKFDNCYFNFSKKEAVRMSPEHRFTLMHSLKAFYDAGYTEENLKESNTGFFYPTNDSTYNELVPENAGLLDVISGFEGTRVANFLDLRGPILSVNTTCSSSLMAIDVACSSLLLNNCTMAMVGGVKMAVPSKQEVRHSKVLSPTFKCKPFDKDANGTLPGEGVGFLILKRLEDAKKDNDPIYAVIEGSGVNHGGQRISTMTSPSAEAQTEVLLKAWKKTEINPNEITYIEAHGTGTILGDPIEFKGIENAFVETKETNHTCYISSFKGQIGHLDTLSGLASVIRLIGGMNSKKYPIQAGFETLNPFIESNTNTLKVVNEKIDWKAKNNRRVGGVSSFGLSGTNVHLLVSKEDENFNAKEDVALKFIQLSEKTASRMSSLKKHLVNYLETKKNIHTRLFANKINRLYTQRDLCKGYVFRTKEELILQFREETIENIETKDFFLVNLEILNYKKELIEEITQENILIRELWNTLLDENPNVAIEIGKNESLRNVVFQYALLKYLTNSIQGELKVITSEKNNYAQKLLTGEITLDELLHVEIDSESKIETPFNYEKFLSYINSTYENKKLVVVGFTNNSLLEKLFISGEIKYIQGDFQVANRYHIFKEIVEAGNKALQVENTPHIFKDLGLPIFELERCWHEKPTQTISKEKNKEQVKLRKEVTEQDIKSTLREIWEKTLEIDDFTEQDDFFSLGGSSLTGLDVITELERKYDIIINYQDIFDFPTFDSQVKLTQTLLQEEAITKIEEVEAKDTLVKTTAASYQKLLDSFETIDKGEKLNAQNILITGGTGFLGAFLIHRLLEVTEAHLYVLTRSTSEEEASIRFWKRFSSYFNLTSSDRITVLKGDILTKNLSPELVNINIDTVYHAAGVVSHFGKIKQSLDINFNGTKHVMDWSIANNITYFNHFSTIAVSGLTADETLQYYETDLDYGQVFSNHIYSKSKFLSEKYVSEHKGEIAVNIFRLGNIGGRFYDGLFQHNINQNNIYTELTALAKIGMYSKSIENISMDLIPIDTTIKNLVDLSLLENKKLNTFHLFLKDTYKVSDVAKELNNNGIQIELVDDITLQNRIETLNEKSAKDQEFSTVKKLFYTNRNQRGLDDFRSPEISIEATNKYLHKQGIKYQYDRKQYLYNTINYLVKNNLI
ncbi:beta-ketoacyl synthase N-terminal-like domain-containing protein [uncultured Kordia sp.]|uniref:beta-ketoacyl synthase N-terminal-like domain-containing protein n=1 Tax=uncultured Kordia sp. TaxID=507699 RepID=UPI0026361E31|nr:beta-ketoacyl synthase N-terminal-like domain-containing protein [uncultured Kordia sp.]